jgi:hypothetical protein
MRLRRGLRRDGQSMIKREATMVKGFRRAG